MSDMLAVANAAMDGLFSPSTSNVMFFNLITDFIDDQLIDGYLGNLSRRLLQVLGGIGLVVLTLWIIIQGYRIMTGQSREPMLALMVNSLRASFIVGVALMLLGGMAPLYETLTDGLRVAIYDTMTGSDDVQEIEDGGPYADLDQVLGLMQSALVTIDAVDTNGDLIAERQKERALWFTGVGLGGPVIMASVAVLVNKFAIGLVLALGPLFILFLLWEPTKPLFHKWLLFGVGSLFSMALLSVTITLAMDMLIAVGAAFWASDMLGLGSTESMTNMAMQQGGMGLILTALIVTIPAMAAMLFQGTLGTFTPYSAFSQQQASQPGAPGQPGYSGVGGGSGGSGGGSAGGGMAPSYGHQPLVYAPRMPPPETGGVNDGLGRRSSSDSATR